MLNIYLGDMKEAVYHPPTYFDNMYEDEWITNPLSVEMIFDVDKSKFVERFLELSLFYRLFSPLDSEMICIFPYFCPYAESAREIREIFV